MPNTLRKLWLALAASAAVAGHPDLYLAFGASDRFARINGLLGEVLPRERVFTLPGRHNWRTWKRLRQAFLDAGRVPGK